MKPAVAMARGRTSQMIAAYSAEERGRSERAFGAHQGRLPQELALKGMTEMDAANRYLQAHYLPAFNEEFSHLAREEGAAFIPLVGVSLDEYLCEHGPRRLGRYTKTGILVDDRKENRKAA